MPIVLKPQPQIQSPFSLLWRRCNANGWNVADPLYVHMLTTPQLHNIQIHNHHHSHTVESLHSFYAFSRSPLTVRPTTLRRSWPRGRAASCTTPTTGRENTVPTALTQNGLWGFRFLPHLWLKDGIFRQQAHCLQKGSLFLLRWSRCTLWPSSQEKRILRDSNRFSEGGQVDGFFGHWYLSRIFIYFC